MCVGEMKPDIRVNSNHMRAEGAILFTHMNPETMLLKRDTCNDERGQFITNILTIMNIPIFNKLRPEYKK